MKIRSIIAILLLTAICLAFTACGETVSKSPDTQKASQTTKTADDPEPENTEPEAPDNPEPENTETESQTSTSTPLLYRVSDGNGGVVWLFGSIHVGREDYYPLPEYVTDAFENSDALAVEVDIVEFQKSLKEQMNAISCLVYSDGSSIADHISPELYEQAVAILEEYNSYSSMLDYYCPAFWSSSIESLMYEELGADTELGIDLHLLNKAKDMDMEIREVESAAFQYQMMADFSPELQEFLLRDSVEIYNDKESAAKEIEEMMDLWASGNEKEFAEYLAYEGEELVGEEKDLYDEYNQAMLIERNISMADYAEDALLSEDEVFICVGAAHIVGADAVAELLSERGYTVECIIN